MNKKLQRIHSEALVEFDDIQSALKAERDQCLEDRRFYSIAGAQWEGRCGDLFENKPRLEMNKIHLAIMSIINEYRNKPMTMLLKRPLAAVSELGDYGRLTKMKKMTRMSAKELGSNLSSMQTLLFTSTSMRSVKISLMRVAVSSCTQFHWIDTWKSMTTTLNRGTRSPRNHILTGAHLMLFIWLNTTSLKRNLKSSKSSKDWTAQKLDTTRATFLKTQTFMTNCWLLVTRKSGRRRSNASASINTSCLAAKSWAPKYLPAAA